MRSCVRMMVAAGLCLAVLGACSQGQDPDGPWQPQELAILRSMTPLPALPPSPGNRVADDARAVTLGQALFFDNHLSGNGKVACATCHEPARYFTDGQPRAKGMGTADRNAPTLMGAQWLPFLFLDGRKDSLWAQAMGPMENAAEHGTDRLAVVHRVGAAYRAEYEALFGTLPPLQDTQRFPQHAMPVPLDPREPLHVAWLAMTEADREAVNRVLANTGKTLEAYQRKLLPQPAPFDRYVQAVLAGDATGAGAMSPSARRGLRAFIGAGQCVNCHHGPLLTDKGFHNLAVPPTPGKVGIDVGRALGAQQVKQDPFRCGERFSDATDCEELRFLNPRFPDFLGAFKTPTLRNVAMTAPYMHGGQFATLEEVVAFYKAPPLKPLVGHRELVLKLLDPDVSTADLVAFLGTLTGPLPDAKWLAAPAAR